jgi:YggT family protein
MSRPAGCAEAGHAGTVARRSPGAAMHPVLALIYELLNIYKWVLIIYVILDWLIAFNVINTYNTFVGRVRDVLYRLTEPVLRQIRNFVPGVGGIDLSPLVALLLIWFIQYVIVYYGF